GHSGLEAARPRTLPYATHATDHSAPRRVRCVGTPGEVKSVLLVTVTRSEYREGQPRGRRRRDRHGRRPRGPLLPRSAPASTSRSEKFDSLVLDALEPIETRWRHRLSGLDVAVDEVPDVRAATDTPAAGMLQDGLVPLSQ